MKKLYNRILISKRLRILLFLMSRIVSILFLSYPARTISILLSFLPLLFHALFSLFSSFLHPHLSILFHLPLFSPEVLILVSSSSPIQLHNQFFVWCHPSLFFSTLFLSFFSSIRSPSISWISSFASFVSPEVLILSILFLSISEHTLINSPFASFSLFFHALLYFADLLTHISYLV